MSWLLRVLTRIVRRIRRRQRKSALAATPPTMADRDLFKEIDDWIRTQKAFLVVDISVDEVANKFCTNRCYVSRAVKAATGRSFPEYVNSIRLEYAMEAARRDPSIRVTDMARIAHYTYPTTFSQAFQRRMHICPRDWLAELRSNPSSGDENFSK